MPIADYTTTISPHKTLAEIQEELATHGARKIMTEYGDRGEATGLQFMIDSDAGLLPIRLPVDVAAVQKVLERDHAPKRDRAQAERVAWRNIYHWVRAQMALLETRMVSMDQIMLPYVTSGETTLYEHIKQNQFRLLAGGGNQ